MIHRECVHASSMWQRTFSKGAAIIRPAFRMSFRRPGRRAAPCIIIALGLAVIEERVAREVNATAIEPVLRADRPKTGVLAFFSAVAGELERNQAVTGCPLNNLAMELSLADPDFRHASNAIFERWVGVLAQRFQDDDPALAPRQAGALATLVIAAYSGAMAMAKASQSALPLRDCAVQLEKLLP
jgi:Tetracyclin repressor-like, C-terminal domain